MTPGPKRPSSKSQPFAPAALRGAVDLGALAAAREAQQLAEDRQRRREAGDAPEVVVDVTTASFQAEVVDRSFTVPVVVDLWATWCGPCKQLSPVLEKLADEGAGSWMLAKVDTDAEPGIAAAFQVQSVPTVVAVLKGQPLPMFSGALPEAQLRQVIAELLKAAKENGVTGRLEGAAIDVSAGAQEPDGAIDEAGIRQGDVRHEAAYRAFEAQDWDGAESAFRSVLDREPSDVEAATGIVRAQVMRRTEGVDLATAVAAANASPDDVDVALVAADVELLAGDPRAAFRRLTDLVRRSVGGERDRARSHLLELFEMVGQDDPSVPAARAELASALF